MLLSRIEPGECVYGQSFVWLTQPRDRLDEIKAQLVIMQAHVYHATPEPWPRGSASAAVLINTMVLSSTEDRMLHVGKHAKWNGDLFEDAIVQTFGSCLTETWARPGQPPTPHVGRIMRLHWNTYDISYGNCDDHSKWAVSVDSPWTYIGDIYAMTSQFHRGGGGVLINNRSLWTAMKSIIALRQE